MAKTPTLSNLAVADAADKLKLDHIRGVIKTSDQQYLGSRRALYQALGAIFDLANSLLSEQRLKGFVVRQGEKWGKVADSNGFQPLTVLAFTGSQNATAASKYAKVLQYAAEEKPEAANFADWIEKSGGIEALAALARAASGDPLEQYEETPDERYDRAVAALAEQSIGQLPKSAQVDLPSSYGRALVRQIDGRLEIVGIVPVEEEAVKADIFALVPAEPPHARRKLQDKPLYEIFRLCDLATRWFPKSALSDPSDESFVVDQQLSTDDYTHALQAGVSKKKNVSKKVDLARYSQQTALRFHHSNGHWHVETISTHPSFPVFQCRLTMALPELDPAQVYMLRAAQVNRVASTFAAITNWTVRLRKPTSKQGHDAGGEGEIIFDTFTTDYAWRELSQPKERRAEFLLSRAKLNALGSWFEDFRAASKAGNLGRLPKLMGLSHEGGVSIVVPALNAPDQGADPVTLVRKERQKSGTLLFATSTALELSDDLSDRFFKRQDLMSLVHIAADYGVDFDCGFLEYAEGIAAIRALTDGWSVVIPLAVSLSGHYAGIVELIGNKSMQPSASDASGAVNCGNGEADA